VCGDVSVDPLTNPGLLSANADWDVKQLGNASTDTPAIAELTMGPIYCNAYDENPGADPTVSLGEGLFLYKERWEVPVVSFTKDRDKGGGNEDCQSYDPDNTGNTTGPKSKNKTYDNCQTNQTCTYNETTDTSILAIKAFCQEEVPVTGRGTGYLVYVGAGDPPGWTNCYDSSDLGGGSVAGSAPEDAGFPGSNGQEGEMVCEVLVGGFPTVKGVVSADMCNDLFPAVGGSQPFELKQAMNLALEYPGNCTSPTQPPETTDEPSVVNAYSRVCNSDLGNGNMDTNGLGYWDSGAGPRDRLQQYGLGDPGDGFDNEYRECPPHRDNSTSEALLFSRQTARFDSVTVAPPTQSVNLECNGGTDSGVAWLYICGSDTFDVNTINIGADDLPEVTIEGGQLPHDYSIEVATSGPCAPVDESGVMDTIPDLRLKYYTCKADMTGLAQVIWTKAWDGQCTSDPVVDHDTCPVGIQATGTDDRFSGIDIISTGIMDVEVVKTQSIPSP